MNERAIRAHRAAPRRAVPHASPRAVPHTSPRMRAVARAPVALVARERRATIRSNRARRDARVDATNERENATSSPITRRGIINAASLALAAPLAIDAAHDLGFITGDEDLPADLPAVGANEAVAVFAGGCFWCMTAPFETLDGVRAVTSGYIGGDVARPRYRDVGSGKTGHVESVRVVYDAAKTSYEKLLSVYWRQIDATRDDGQFVDAGKQYRPVIWAMDDAQKRAAEKSKEELERANVFGAPIKVEVVDASGMTFWPAERYHQDYYLKNPNRYRFYRAVSGRDEYIASVWGIERSS